MITRIDGEQLSRIADLVRAQPEVEGFDFCGPGLGNDLFPPEGQIWAIDYFFAVTLHQYGFWTDDGAGYVEPYYGTLDGESRKGAEFMFRALLRTAADFPAFLSPDRQAVATREQLAAALSEDDGECRLPMFDSHLELTNKYGQYLLARDLDPQRIVEESNRSDDPIKKFVSILRNVPGYAEDPLQKKLYLLAIILKNRPEHFLEVSGSDLRPVVDYHIQRTFLRTGMVDIAEGPLRTRLEGRRFLTESEEERVRRHVYQAVDQLCRESGKDVAAIDWLFFKMRKTCHEMQAPDCPTCPVQTVCKQHTELFQPVLRTTYY
jgi:hypothetical protein